MKDSEEEHIDYDKAKKNCEEKLTISHIKNERYSAQNFHARAERLKKERKKLEKENI